MNQKRENDSDLELCPKCRETSLLHNWHTSMYECLNPQCKHTLTETQYELPLEVKGTTEPAHTRSRTGIKTPIMSRWWVIVLGFIIVAATI